MSNQNNDIHTEDVGYQNIRLKLDLILAKINALELKSEATKYTPTTFTVTKYTFTCRRCKKPREQYSENKNRICGLCENELIEEYESDEEDPK